MSMAASYKTKEAVAVVVVKRIEQSSSAGRIIGGLHIGWMRWLRRLLSGSEEVLRSSSLFLVRKQASQGGIGVDWIEWIPI
jgi:hypothetical protein